MSGTTTPQLTITTDDGGTLQLVGAERDGAAILRASRLFLLEADARLLSTLESPAISTSGERTEVTGAVSGSSLRATWSATRIGGGAVWELGLRLTNTGTSPVTITRMDPLAADLDGGRWTTLSFKSAWGDEFRPEWGTTDYHHRLESRSGRSSHGASPWLGFERDGAGFIATPAWSGNWHITVDEGTRVTAGISTWLFATVVEPGESVTAPSVVIAASDTRDNAATELVTAIGKDWIPRSVASDRLDTEWNHWWPYEDAEVTEQVIWDNAAVATDLGIGVSTVDAGWFGPSDGDTYWGDYRGDWDLVNAVRFPSGLKKLGDGIRAADQRPGIWVEAEAIGYKSALRTSRPEILALAVDGRRHDPSYGVGSQGLDPDDPTFLGYICMGSPGGREFVLESMSRVVSEMGAEWIKLDFNVDPDAGCTRTDHGHGAADGLLRHYEGLYWALDEFRARHPETVLEACSSGGLRIDLGLARHVHTMFLSDPDYTEHALQVMWGASLMLPPASILHWPWSQWRGDHPSQQLDWATLPREDFETMLRAALLHRFGISVRLVELRDDLLEAVREHVAIYAELVAPLVRDGVLHRLGAQPQRGGFGERMPAFQLSGADRHVVTAFRLPGGETGGTVHPVALDADREYTVTNLATGTTTPLSETGIPLEGDHTSWLFHIIPA